MTVAHQDAIARGTHAIFAVVVGVAMCSVFTHIDPV